jgi:hypothetical protein
MRWEWCAGTLNLRNAHQIVNDALFAIGYSLFAAQHAAVEMKRTCVFSSLVLNRNRAFPGFQT